MIIAVVAVRMVEVAINEIIDVVAVRYGFVTAVGPMNVTSFVTVAGMLRCTIGWVLVIDFEGVTFDAVFCDVMQVAVVEVIDVVVVLYGFVAAARTVLVVMVGVSWLRHFFLSFRLLGFLDIFDFSRGCT